MLVVSGCATSFDSHTYLPRWSICWAWSWWLWWPSCPWYRCSRCYCWVWRQREGPPPLNFFHERVSSMQTTCPMNSWHWPWRVSAPLRSSIRLPRCCPCCCRFRCCSAAIFALIDKWNVNHSLFLNKYDIIVSSTALSRNESEKEKRKLEKIHKYTLSQGRALTRKGFLSIGLPPSWLSSLHALVISILGLLLGVSFIAMEQPAPTSAPMKSLL